MLVRKPPSAYWHIPEKAWAGETVVIVGGGPSLKGFDLSVTRHCHVLAVNNAFELVPWAEYLYFYDARWFRWNVRKLKGFKGQLITASETAFQFPCLRVHRSWQDAPFGKDQYQTHGLDSGHMATVIAYKLGAKRIILAGFDMGFKDGESHWHPDHEIPSSEANYVARFRPQYALLNKALAEKGVELLRCTPSALDYLPEVSLYDEIMRNHGGLDENRMGADQRDSAV